MMGRANWTAAIVADLGDPARKRALNERLFTTVAPRYDLVTRVLSFGRDGAWKRALIAALPDVGAPRCLDLACGTGDIAGLLARRYPDGAVEGIDLTEPMLVLARKRHACPPAERPGHLRFSQQDMNALEAADGSVDVVTGGYALRNAPDLGRALQEVRRVLKPGGTAAFLDFSKPVSALGRRLQLAVLGFWGGLWGLLLHGDPGVYAYLAHSLARFPDRRAFRLQMEAAGFEVVLVRRFFLGIMELMVARKMA
jgi:demethylmenaquinone methyltransferase/2-methoxy-6-polyprenyl-1,4-benzoquinol methylase